MRLKQYKTLSFIFLLSTLSIKTTLGQHADPPWPMLQHDLKRSGNSPYVGPEQPALKWSFSDSTYRVTPPIIGSDGTIYFGSNRGLYAVNPDGLHKWLFITTQESMTMPSLGPDGTIYAVTSDSLIAVYPDGTLRWRILADIPKNSSFPPTIGFDGTIFIVTGQTNNKLLAIEPNGASKWTYSNSGLSQFRLPAIGSNGLIYLPYHRTVAGDNLAFLLGLNQGGEFVWGFGPGGGINHFQPPAIGPDNTIYFLVERGLAGNYRINAINLDGTSKWVYYLTGPSSMAIAPDGTVYVCSGLNILSLTQDGTLKWSFRANGNTSNPVVDSEGTIYVGSSDNLYAFNPDGLVKWKLPFSAGSGGLALASNESIYFVSRNAIQAIGSATTPSVQVDIEDHLEEKLQGGATFFQKLYDTLFESVMGPSETIGDITVNVQFSNGSNFEKVELILVSPDDPSVEATQSLSKKEGNIWEQRFEILVEPGIDFKSFFDILAIISKAPGNFANPFIIGGYRAPATLITKVRATTNEGQVLEFVQEKQIPTWDRHLGDQVNLLPFGTGVFEVLAASPIDIIISDLQGRRLGVRDGQQFLEIPNSISTGDGEPEGLFVFGNDDYELEIHGSGTGTFTLEFMQNTVGSELDPIVITYENVPITNITALKGKVGAFVDNYTLQVDNDGDGIFESTLGPTSIVVSVKHNNDAILPENFALKQNYPNPFNPETRIEYELPKSTYVKFEILNVLGQRVRTLVNEVKPAGSYTVVWSGLTDQDVQAPSGVYFYRIKAGGYVEIKKLLLLQ